MRNRASTLAKSTLSAALSPFTEAISEGGVKIIGDKLLSQDEQIAPFYSGESKTIASPRLRVKYGRARTGSVIWSEKVTPPIGTEPRQTTARSKWPTVNSLKLIANSLIS